ncbi:MAG: MFS transporter [Geminicoccaceae bacterium]
MNGLAVVSAEGARPHRHVVVTVLGLMQILAWGSSYYLLAVLAPVIATDTGWPLPWIVGGLAFGLIAAALVSPWVGRTIERHGGRPVLAASAGLFAVGLCGLAAAPILPVYLASWFIVGLAMGAGLYDAAFATLGRLYGQGARQAITALTLFGGFASTACWPLSAWLATSFGWRGTCLIYAALHVAIALPLYLLALPRGPGSDERETHAAQDPNRMTGPVTATVRPSRGLFLLLAVTITLGSAISALMSVHLLSILQERGVALAAAVALGALVGPSQVGARAIEMLIGRYHHPIWTMVASMVLVAAGVGLLWAGLPVIAIALVFYGAGIGLESIARGTLPLALFGALGYPTLMGRLALPSLLAQAASPVLGALLLQGVGPDGTLTVLLGAAALDIVLVFSLFIWMQLIKNNSATNMYHIGPLP